MTKLTPEQITAAAHEVVKLMTETKKLMQGVSDDDLLLITKEAEKIDPNVFRAD